MALYESDFTKFIQDWLQKHPEEQEERRKGRALWWDKPQDLAAQRSAQEAHVPQKAYYYQSDVSPTSES